MAKNKEIVELKNGFTRNQARTSPVITEAKTKMTKNQLKAFYQCATILQMADNDFFEVIINAKEFSEKLGISKTNDDLKNLCRSLGRISFEVENEETWEFVLVFSKIKFDKKKDEVSFKFNNEMKPYLLNLQQFTKIHQVKYIMDFESIYAIRFYTLLKDYRLMSQRDFNIEDLNTRFQLPKSYDSYTRFYKYVLKPAIDEINTKSDLWVSEPEVIGKKGKKITDFRLYFRNKAKQMSDDFTEVLLKQYNKFKSFNVFKNCYFFQNDYLVKISKIEYDPNTNFFNAYTNNGINDYSILGSVNKDDFIKKLINGIYLAINHIYENEKKEQIPALQWQDEKDKAKRFKAIYEEWIGFNPL